MQPDFNAFFETYADAYNRSLGETVDAPAIRGHFAESFIGAGPQGVLIGDNDETFTEALNKAYAFYKSIGMRDMAVRDVTATAIDPLHYLVQVGWRATCDRNGETVTIPFSVAYLLQHRDAQPRIFAFIAGDEMALYRQYGLIS